METDSKTYDQVIQEIMAEQNATKITDIDCKKVSNKNFVQLGDSVMEKMVGSHELHEQMDMMMGEEGELRMHLAMGKNWLGCSSLEDMMGFNMMPMMMRIMGNYYPAYYSRYDYVFVFGILGWILFLILLVFVIIESKKRRKK